MRGATPSLPYTNSCCGTILRVDIFSYEFPSFILDSHSRIRRYITNTLEMLSTTTEKIEKYVHFKWTAGNYFRFLCMYACAVIYYRIYWFPVTQKLACSESITSHYVGKNVDILLPNQTSRDLRPKHKIAWSIYHQIKRQTHRGLSKNVKENYQI